MGARIYQWAANDSGHASTASMIEDDPWASLESFWRDCRTLPGTRGTTQAPPTIRYYVSLTAWVASSGYSDVQWIDADQLRDLGNTAEEMSPSPLKYSLTMRLRDLGTP